MGASYADTQLDSTFCAGKKKGACALVRIKNGQMPQMKGCTGDAEKDGTNGFCLRPSEIAKLESWIANGFKER